MAAKTWSHVFETYIHKTSSGIDLNASDVAAATKEQVNTYVAESFLFFKDLIGGNKDEDLWCNFREFFEGWTTTHFARMSPHLRTIVADYLYYHGVYSEIGRNRAERLATIADAKEFIPFPAREADEVTSYAPYGFISASNARYKENRKIRFEEMMKNGTATTPLLPTLELIIRRPTNQSTSALNTPIDTAVDTATDTATDATASIPRPTTTRSPRPHPETRQNKRRRPKPGPVGRPT
ncbi:hypothetical protein K449DRAFT_429356 [Hypoxylon sp. EC38]|nr:hypothetical protein K449DRAFT_429356 [Hypoxylon sp. EC38]